MAPTSMPAAANPLSGGGHPLISREMSELLTVPIAQVDVESNVRTELGDLDELAASIKSEGLLQPIAVHRGGMRPDSHGFIVDHGHRRLAACRLAGLTEIAVIVSPERVGVSRPIAQLVENLQRRDLGPLEEAEAFRAILTADPALTQVVLAGRIGRSAPYVSNALRILDLEPAVRDMAAAGAITGAHAKALAGLKGKGQVDMAERAVRSHYSSHQLEDEITRNRKFADQERERNAATAVAVAGRYEKALAALLKKKVPFDAPIYVPASGYYGSAPAGPMRAAAAKAGYTNVTEGRCESRAGTLGCDCVAWTIDLGYDTPKVVPGCLNQAHRHAKYEAETAERIAGDEQRKRVRDRLEEVLLTDAQQTSRLVGRLSLWLALSWRIEEWAKKWNGRLIEQLDAIEGKAVKKRTAWQTIASLTDAALSQELSHAMATELRDQSGYPVDWTAFEAELAGPAPDLRTTAEVQADVTAKRAERRAGVASCRVCGCTDFRACAGGRSWVEPDLCSACPA